MPTLTKTNKKLEEIELVRGIAIIAVLLIHTTGPALRAFTPASIEFSVYVVINKAMQFAVPLFIMVSAMLLAYRYNGDPTINWREFFQKRWKQVAIPYILWTLIYIVSVRMIILQDISGLYSIKHWLYWFLLGKGYFHLYFLAIIIQFYFLFPFIFWGWRAIKLGFFNYLIFLALVQVSFYWINRLYIYQQLPVPGSIVFSYLFPIGMGLLMGGNYNQILPRWHTYRPLMIAIALLSGSTYIYLNYISLLGQKIDTFTFQMLWHVYVTSFSIIIIMEANYIVRATTNFVIQFKQGLSKLGQMSFGIYLIHPFFLLLWQIMWQKALGTPDYEPLMHLSIWGGLFFVSVLSWVSVTLLKRTVLNNLLFGGR